MVMEDNTENDNDFHDSKSDIDAKQEEPALRDM
jgi:hypothetical protein